MRRAAALALYQQRLSSSIRPARQRV